MELWNALKHERLDKTFQFVAVVWVCDVKSDWCTHFSAVNVHSWECLSNVFSMPKPDIVIFPPFQIHITLSQKKLIIFLIRPGVQSRVFSAATILMTAPSKKMGILLQKNGKQVTVSKFFLLTGIKKQLIAKSTQFPSQYTGKWASKIQISAVKWFGFSF